MTEVNFSDTKRHLWADGCSDLLRGVACLRWSLLAGKSYEEAVRPWIKNLPELFTTRVRPSGNRPRNHYSPRNERNSHVRHT